MKIYVGHSNKINYKRDLYLPLKNSSLASDHSLIFPHDKSESRTNSKSIVKNCDLMIAEVSNPSTGLGVELGWADAFNIPIICIFKKGSKISQSLKVIYDDLIEYSDEEDLIKKLEYAIYHK